MAKIKAASGGFIKFGDRRAKASAAVALIIVVAIVTFFVASADEGGSDAAWDGTSVDYSWYTNPDLPNYTISNEAQFKGFANIVNGKDLPTGVVQNKFFGQTIKLANNLDLNNKNWVPIGIGTDNNTKFKGTFDGNNNIISKYSVSGDSLNAGLFGYVFNGTIKNLTISSGSVVTTNTVTAYAGGLVGMLNAGTIDNCKNIGVTVTTNSSGDAFAGGLVGGTVGKGLIQNCNNSSIVTANSTLTGGTVSKDKPFAGGVVGWLVSPTDILNCSNSGTISGSVADANRNVYLGGVVGNSNSIVYKCTNTGLFTVTSTPVAAKTVYIGGVVGINLAGAVVQNCSNEANLSVASKNATFAGGVVGANQGTVLLCNSTKNLTVSGASVANVGNVVGENTGNLQSCTNSGAVAATGSGTVSVGGIAGKSSGTISNCNNGGSVNSVMNAGGIVGLQTEKSITQRCANSGTVNSSVVRDATGGTTPGFVGIGGIVGNLANDELVCTILNCYNTGSVTTSDSSNKLAYVGGIVGNTFTNDTISFCYNIGNINPSTSSKNSGGILGNYALGSILSNCYWKNPSGSTASCVGLASGTVPANCASFTNYNTTMAPSGVYLDEALNDPDNRTCRWYAAKTGGVPTQYPIFAQYVVTPSSENPLFGTISPATPVKVDYGGYYEFELKPNVEYMVIEVKRDGILVDFKHNRYTIDNVTRDSAVKVSFILISYTVTTDTDGNGTISPSEGVSVDHGGSKTFTFTPNAGYEVDKVKVGGIVVTPSTPTSHTISNVLADTTLYVTFKLKTYTIVASAGANGSISPSGNITVTHGASQTFTFTPSTGYRVEHLLINGTVTAHTTNSYTATVTSDMTLEVVFTLRKYQITATVTGGNGTVSPASPWVTHGTNQTFTFTPTAGYEVATVKADNVTTTVANSYTFTNVTAAHTLEVTFKLKTYTITATAGANGTISPGTTTVNHGANQTFTFTPSTGYLVDTVKVDGTAQSPAPDSHTFTNVTAAHTIAVTFKIKTYTITATAGANGTINPGTTTVNHGSNQTFAIAPNTGYTVDVLTVDGNPVTNATTYTFSNVTAPHTIGVTFKNIKYSVTYSPGTHGTFTSVTTDNLNYGNTTPAEPSITGNPGYNFVGWNPAPAVTVTETVTYVAQWSIKTDIGYTVKYYKASVSNDNLLGTDTGNGTFGTDIPYTDGNYIVAGYKKPGVKSGQQTITAVPADNVMSIVYEVDTTQTFAYVIYYYIDETTTAVPGITTPVTGTGYVGQTLTIAQPRATGYKVKEGQSLSLTVNNLGTAAAIVYYVIDPNQWTTLTFAKGDHAATGQSDVTYNVIKNASLASQSINAPTIAGADGWSFGSWSPAFNNAVSINAATTHTAQWTANKYDATFKGNFTGSSYSVTVSQTYGQNTVMPDANPVRAGYTLSSWNTASDGSGTSIPSIYNVAGTSTYYAQWTLTHYSVKYTVSGDIPTGFETPATVTGKHYGDTITMATIGEYKGYSFDGWLYKGVVYRTNFEMPAEDVEFTGTWTHLVFSLTYKWKPDTTVPAGAVLPAAVTGLHFGSVVVLTLPTVTGYTLNGWEYEGDVYKSNFIMNDYSAVLVGYWTANNYTATFNLNYTGSPAAGTVQQTF
ncbi:MAG: hypothetical protein KA502_00970, partial [Candidatus Methanomethylophilaceae archaeon]|nr:hypothetical protein [Candidatus Methanomethylophilaceae archaeon]